MQNLLTKFVVLTGVIGASCGIAYQAHKEITKAQSTGGGSTAEFSVPADADAESSAVASASPQPLTGQLEEWHSLLGSEGQPTTATSEAPTAPEQSDEDEPSGSLFAVGWPPASAEQSPASAVAPQKFPVALSSDATNRDEEIIPASGSAGVLALPAPAAPSPAESPFSNGAGPLAAAEPTPAPIQESEIPWGVERNVPLKSLPEGHPGPVLMTPPPSQLEHATATSIEGESGSKVQQVSGREPLPLALPTAPAQTEQPAERSRSNQFASASDPFAAAGTVTPADSSPAPTPAQPPEQDEEVLPLTPLPQLPAESPVATPKPLPFGDATTPSAEQPPAFGRNTPAPVMPAAPATNDNSSPWPSIPADSAVNDASPTVDPFAASQPSTTSAPPKEDVVPERPFLPFAPGVTPNEPRTTRTAPAMPLPAETEPVPQRRPEVISEEVTPSVGAGNPFTSPPESTIPQPARDDEQPSPFSPSPATPSLAAEPQPESGPQPQPLPITEPLNVVNPAPLMTGTGTVPADAPKGPQQPELKIEKIAPKEAILGEPLIYSIVVRNIGGSAAHKVVVEDRIPKGVDAQDLGTSPQAFVTGDKLFWELGTLQPGDERKIQLRVIPIEAGDIGSVATVSFAASVSASIRITAPKLGLTINGPAEVAVGEQVNYRFRVTNSGEGEARKVFLRMLLPAGVQHPGGNDLEYEVGSLPPGQSRDVDLNLMAIGSGLIHPEGLVTIDGNVKDKQQVDLNVIESRLTLERTGPTKRFIGRPAVYQNIVTNASSENLTNLTVTETIPPGVAWKPQPGSQARWNAESRKVTWTIPELRPGESVQLASQITAEQVGDHAGALSALDAKGNRADLDTSLAVKGFADLGIDVSRPGQPVLVGEQVSMRVSIRNDGTAAAKNVQAAFEIPKGLNFVSAKGPVGYNPVGSMVAFSPIEELPVGQKQEFDIILTAAEVNTDARVKVHLDTADLDTPIQREELIRISE